MKRILPLILALVAGMAQADSNSDYRAGSDFARQIQGQGTGSIQSLWTAVFTLTRTVCSVSASALIRSRHG